MCLTEKDSEVRGPATYTLYLRLLLVELGFIVETSALVPSPTRVLKSCNDFPLGILITQKMEDN